MWIAVFRTGKHMDSKGTEKTWTEGDLDSIVSKYNPKEHEAPIVIGHPKDNAPAYGWVEGLKRVGDTLWADIKPAVAEFMGWVQKGLFKKRSISLYPDLGLRHIGFLGAQPPAVKGLPDYAFSDGDAAEIEFEELDSRLRGNNDRKGGRGMNFWEELKGFLKGRGVDVGDDYRPGQAGSFTEAEVKAAVSTAVRKAKTEMDASFAEKARLLSDQESALRTKEAELARRSSEASRKEIADFCEPLKKQGVITPAMEKMGMGITCFIQAIAALEQTYEFAEADDKGIKGRQTPLEFMRAFLSHLPRSIVFREIAQDKDDPGGGPEEQKRERLIKQYGEHNKCDYKTAMLAVSKEHPELFELERR